MSSDSNSFSSTCGLCGAAFLLRMWVALRLVLSGFAKFRTGDAHGYSFQAYKDKMALISESTATYTFIPGWAASMYGMVLPWVLISIGFWVLLGAGRQLGLFLAGLTFLSLFVGVAALPDDQQALALGLHVGLTAAALALSKYDCLSIDGLLKRGKKN